MAELTAFNNYNFYLPENVQNQDTIISVIGGNETDISGSQVHAVVPQNAALSINDRVILINNNYFSAHFGVGREIKHSRKGIVTYSAKFFNGLGTETPSIRGASGIFELDRIIKPRGDEKFSLDLSGVGSVGKNRGLTGRLGINWRF